jgi:ABC-2 type transport system ATP-binding protein
MRDSIRALATEQGKTVFLSSHLLSEVEQVCDRVAIVYKGEIVREGAVADLVGSKGRVRVETDSPERVAAALNDKWSVQLNGGGAAYVEAGRADAPLINRKLVEAGLNIYQPQIEKQSLEEYFLEVTKDV